MPIDEYQPRLGHSVLYTAKNTRGPRAAMVIAVKKGGKFNLLVFNPNGSMFPAYDVTDEPSTAVEHYWSPLEAG